MYASYCGCAIYCILDLYSTWLKTHLENYKLDFIQHFPREGAFKTPADALKKSTQFILIILYCIK